MPDCLHLKGRQLIKFVIFIFVSLSFTPGDVRLTAVFSLVGDARDRSNTDIPFNEVFSSEISEHLSVLKSLFAFILALACNKIKFSWSVGLHSLKDLDKVGIWHLKGWLRSKRCELLVHFLGPVVDLVVNNVDTFETLVELEVLILNLVKFLTHHYQVLVAVSNDDSLTFTWLSTVKRHIVQAWAQLFISLL